MSGQVSTSANVVVGSVGIPHDAIDPAQIQVGVVLVGSAHKAVMFPLGGMVSAIASFMWSLAICEFYSVS